MSESLIYLDFNATTPIAPEVAAAMRPYLESAFGNPSSSHRFGIEARRAVERARTQLAALFDCHPDEIVFTSGGTEANNAAIKGTAYRLRERGRHIITTAIEHPAVTEVCRFLEQEGFGVSYVAVDGSGRVDPAAVERAIRGDTILISVMHANNEVGTIQPIGEIGRIARGRGVRLHSDGAQAAGKIAIRVADLGVDLYSIAGHKLYAPKGIGALYVRRGVEVAKFMHGAQHEQNRRAGTENVLEIVGLGMAAEIARRDLERNAAHMQAMRDRLRGRLMAAIPALHVNGHPEFCLPNTLSISVPHVEANAILDELDQVAASAGAACHAEHIDVSHVLKAMGIPEEIAMGTIRLSVGRETTPEEIDRAAEELIAVATRLGGDRLAGAASDSDDSGAATVIAPGETIRLTRFTHGLGCACKIRPQALEEILRHLPRPTDPDLLIGTETSDDAAVYRITPDLAIVETLDFFTPIVDDPRAFGAIAAANALSDIYAMGARPLFALNIVGFPVRRLPLAVLAEILAGANEVAAEAGIPIAGGHSIDDPEPKFGWAVTGIVDPRRVLANHTAHPGDALVLTKPIGLGILSTAAKRGAGSPEAIARGIAVMRRINRVAAEVMNSYPVSACTDVTGFGLIGHLLEMTRGSGVTAEVWAAAVPVLAEVEEWARAGLVPGGTRDNLAHAGPYLEWSAAIPQVTRLILCDAQTSGGLLIALPEERAGDLVADLRGLGVDAAAQIGRITGSGPGSIAVRLDQEERA
ncbi:MAG: selenide, water dikinase SelD [Candidatus Eisenbacteria bacterium]